MNVIAQAKDALWWTECSRHRGSDCRRASDPNPCRRCAALAALERYEVVEGAAAPAGDPLNLRWYLFGDVTPGEARLNDDERPAILLVEREP